MLKLLADENIESALTAGLRRNAVDIVTVQEAGLTAAADDEVLAWAASHGRVLLSHDRRTMNQHSYARVARGEAMPGVLLIGKGVSIGRVIYMLIEMIEPMEPHDAADRVLFVR
jgi:hypothetical protein